MSDDVNALFDDPSIVAQEGGEEEEGWIPYVPDDEDEKYDPTEIPKPFAPPADGYHEVGVSLDTEINTAKWKGPIYRSRKRGKVESVCVIVVPRILLPTGKLSSYLERTWLSSSKYTRDERVYSSLGIFMQLVGKPLKKGYDLPQIEEHVRVAFAEADEGLLILGAKTKAAVQWLALDKEGLPIIDKATNEKTYRRFLGRAKIEAEAHRQWLARVAAARAANEKEPVWDPSDWYRLTADDGTEVVARAKISDWVARRS